MTRVFQYKNIGIYVADERGGQHHMPHADVRERGDSICTVNLYTLEPLQKGKVLPRGLLKELEAHQDELLAEWERLNSDE